MTEIGRQKRSRREHGHEEARRNGLSRNSAPRSRATTAAKEKVDAFAQLQTDGVHFCPPVRADVGQGSAA
jgi:hypothetical protein